MKNRFFLLAIIFATVVSFLASHRVGQPQPSLAQEHSVLTITDMAQSNLQLGAAQPSMSPTSIIPFADPDDPTELAPWWEWYQGGSPASGYDLSDGPNILTLMVGPGTDQWLSNNSAPYVGYAVTGDFEVDVKLNVLALTNWVVGGLGIMSSEDPETWIRIVYALDNKVYFNKNGEHIITAPYFSNEVYLKLKRQGSLISAYYSVTGDDWTLLKEDYEYVLPEEVKIYLLGFTQLAQGDVIKFQDLNIIRDCSANVQPLIFVTGWEGSKPSANQDDQLKYFFADNGHLASYGYVEGCNLFYADATSPYLWLAENGQVIRDNLCLAYAQVKASNPNWNGHFDIIGYSYGGLRARAYLEDTELYGDLLGTQCSPGHKVYVDRLFTLGTPHGGEWGDLPFSFLIGFTAIWQQQWPALVEILPPIRLVQNLASRAPEYTDYYLLGGDSRGQAGIIAPFLGSLGWNALLTPNDFAVHRSSAQELDGFEWQWLYPHTEAINTPDLHGQVPGVPPWLIRSYVNPDTTLDEEICPRMSIPGCGSLEATIDTGTPVMVTSVKEVIEGQQEPQQTGFVPLHDVDNGVLATDEIRSGIFEVSGSGSSRMDLHWTSGDLALELRDPAGNPINPNTVPGDPNVGLATLDTGYGLLTSYFFTNTLSGTWVYTITAESLTQEAGYRFSVQPPTPVGVTLSTSSWLPFGTPAVITASVSYSVTTLLPGAVVTVTVNRPGGSMEMLPLFDDGNHQDGDASDGVYGNTFTNTSLDGVYGLFVRATGDYTGEPFERTAATNLVIGSAGAMLTGNYADQGIDADGNGFYEVLAVLVDLQVTQVSTYTLVADLIAGDTFLTHARVTAKLQPGARTMTLNFDGEVIYQSGIDGPYLVRNVLLIDESPFTNLIEAADKVLITAPYDHRSFGNGWFIWLPVIIRS